MMKCSEKAFAKCPARHLCIGDATFIEGSDCDKFIQQVENEPITNADRIRAASNEELVWILTYDTLMCESVGIPNGPCSWNCDRCLADWLDKPDCLSEHLKEVNQS